MAEELTQPPDLKEIPLMPLRHIRLTPEEQEYVTHSVESGRFANAGELVQAALRALKREERVRLERGLAERVDAVVSRTPAYWGERQISSALFPSDARR